MAGIVGDRDVGRWEKEKSHLYKNAKLMPPFPGSACKTQPDMWEDWWEKVFALKELLKVDDTMLAYMIKETAGKHS